MPDPTLPLWQPGAGAPPPGRFLAVVPGEAAPLLPVALPAGLRGPGRVQVARRMLADRLGPWAAGLALRPAPLGTGPDGWGAMLAAARADLARWQAALAETGAGARAVALLPDYLALPAAPGVWVLAAGGSRVRARLGPGDGFAAETGLAAALLAEARARGPAPRAVLVAEGPLPGEVAAALEGLAVVETVADLPAGVGPPRALALGEPALDLRRDPEAEAARRAERLAGLVWPAGLALAGGLAWAAAVAIETAALETRARAVADETLAQAQARLLGPVPVLDLRLQVARALAARQAAATGGGALALVHDLAQGLAGSGVAPARLTLRAEGAEAALEVELVAPGFAALQAAVAALEARGLRVTVARQAGAGSGAVTAALAVRR
jgi:general secretion pathway protein L